MSSNLYRNRETMDPQTSTYKKNKSSRSNASTKRKRKKHHLSIGQPLEKQKTIDNTNKKNFTNQLISLIQKLHSPKNNKSHNHSHSEVYSQGVKKIVRSKNGQHYKASNKSSMHTRSNTTENGQKVRKKVHQLQDYSNVFKTITLDTQ